MKYRSLHFLTILLLSLIATPGWSSQSTFSQIYVFGDSLSDTGNFASINGPFPNPPFFNNRVTNGLTAVDVLAQSIGLRVDASLHLIGPAVGTNYAVTGARTAGISAIDLSAQVSAFSANVDGVAPADALYIVYIGGNDVRDARDTTDSFEAGNIISTAVLAEVAQIKNLIDLGAKNILVVNVADIGAIPETQLIAAQLNNSLFATRATQLSTLYNSLLKNQLKLLERATQMELEIFDQFEEFNELLEDAKTFGFTNTTEACFSTVTLTFNSGCNFGANFDQYIFFDEIHPTARTNRLIGKELIEEVEEFEEDDD